MNSHSLRRVALACAALFSMAAAPMAAQAGVADHPGAVARALAHLQQDSREAAGHAFEARDAIVETDGSEHVRFARRYQGLRVIGGDVVVHSRHDGSLNARSSAFGSVTLSPCSSSSDTLIIIVMNLRKSLSLKEFFL